MASFWKENQLVQTKTKNVKAHGLENQMVQTKTKNVKAHGLENQSVR
jgi:hypothetical protein